MVRGRREDARVHCEGIKVLARRAGERRIRAAPALVGGRECQSA